MKLTKVQNDAVNDLLDIYYKKETEVAFNAPTGSGKTFMIANFISKIIENNQNENLIFVIATLSSSELPLQFSNKIKEYNSFLSISLNVEHKISPSNSKIKVKDYEPQIIPKSNKVLIFGKSSFTKSSIFIERGIFQAFLDQIKNQNYKLIYIRDEAHYGSKKENLNKDEQSFEQKIRNISSFTIEMTASPKENLINKVIISEKNLEDNENKYLLKTTLELNKDISKSNLSEINDLELLEIALDEFILIKKKYINELEEEINPAILIQVDSKTTKNIDKFDNELIKIKKAIEEKGLTWYQYFGEEKIGSTKETLSLQKISKNNSTIDVIIFKIGPATGWDIPRANFLVQLRNINSQTLNIQTIGRIKRNPIKDLSRNSITDKYYLYSNYQQAPRELNTYFLEEKYNREFFHFGTAKKNPIDEEIFKIKFQNWFRDTFLKNYNFQIIDNYNFYFYENMKTIKLNIIKLKDEKDYKVDYYKNELIDLLDLKIFILELKKDNIRIFNLIQNTIKNEANKKILEIDQFIFAIFKTDWDLIKSTFLKYEKEVENIDYEINIGKELPKKYNIWQDKGKSQTSFKKIKDIYLYFNFIEEAKYSQILDSDPEIAFMKKIVEQISTIRDYDSNNKVKLFAKNPALSGIYFEYLNQERIVSKSFIDFILKIGKYTLYIEIKADDQSRILKDRKLRDYNPKKTKAIEEGFENYIKSYDGEEIIFVLSRMNYQLKYYDGTSYDEFYTNEPWIKEKIKNGEQLNLVKVLKYLNDKEN